MLIKMITSDAHALLNIFGSLVTLGHMFKIVGTILCRHCHTITHYPLFSFFRLKIRRSKHPTPIPAINQA
jgi:hypothetical protein